MNRFVFHDCAFEKLEVFRETIFLCFVWPLGCCSKDFSQDS